MNIQDFISNFADQFDETDTAEFKPDTEFKALDEWSSLTSLSIISMVDEEYGVSINGDDIREAETIEDLYDIIKNRK
jgi:acyl carrier protein